jgi:formylmethanofuran dehydrogenase subunit B
MGNKIDLVIKRDGKVESKREVTLKDINLDERCKLMDLMMQVSKDGNTKFFTNLVQSIRIATDMTDEQINEFSNEEIMQLFQVIGDALNKKK